MPCCKCAHPRPDAAGRRWEVAAAAEAVTGVLAHPLFARVRAASAAGRCARECPLLWRAPDGLIVEGTVDVVFEEDDALTVVDFKTDREPSDLKDQYERQLTLYCRAFARCAAVV